MNSSGLSKKLTHLVHSKGNIWARQGEILKATHQAVVARSISDGKNITGIFG
jgi:hypothetical protein